MPDSAARTAAFERGGESVLAPASSGRVASGEAARILVSAMSRRLGLEIWAWAYGTTPDELNTRDEVRDWMAGDEAWRPDPERIRWLARGAAAVPPRRLAMQTGVEGTGDRWAVFAEAGLPFWVADRDLGVRLAWRDGALSFRAHHPVIHRALEERCEREGLFLL